MNIQQIYERINFAGPDDCWEWQRGRSSDGRGRVKFEGRLQYVYRIMWERENGTKIPAGFEALHSCDNPPCVNPRHINVGTHAQNMLEFRERKKPPPIPKRFALANNKATLTAEQIAQALLLEDAGWTRTAVAAHFGVTRRAIQTWREGIARADGLAAYRAAMKAAA